MQPLRFAVLVAIAPLAFCQTVPQFEVATIKASAPGADFRVNLGYHIDGAMVTCAQLSLRDYVRMAYQVKDYQIVAPAWLAENRFDISAKLPDGANKDQVRDMFKSLLEERFHLKTHTESKEFSVYALVVAKDGPHMQESALDPDHDTPKASTDVAATGGREGVSLNLGNGSAFTFADGGVQVTKLTMLTFADLLARFVDRPVVDMTGLAKSYDFSFKLSEEDFRAMQIRSAISAGVVLPPQALALLETSSGDSLQNALQGLGLKLESRKAPLKVLVIDQADKTPTDN